MNLVVLTFALLQQIGGDWERFGSVHWVAGSESLEVLGDLDRDGADDLIAGRTNWPSSGRGTVVVLSGATGAELMRLERTPASFGATIAALGDLNRDGWPDFAVGSPDANVNGLVRNGSVEVFSGADGATLYWRSGFVNLGRFGAYLTALRYDTGTYDLLISAPEVSPNPSGGRGIAYLYRGADGILRFSVDGPEALMAIGWNTAALGSFLTPGSQAFAIGAPHATVNGRPSAGRVTVYSASNGGLIANYTGLRNYFGASITHIPDFDGDRRDDFAVSEDLDSWQPIVHVYSSAAGVVRSLSGVAYSRYGASMYGADFDHDGVSELAIGDPEQIVQGMISAGRVEIRGLPDGGLLETIEGEAVNARIGAKLRGGILNRLGGSGEDLYVGNDSVVALELAQVHAFDDFLFSTLLLISATLGGRVNYHLDFPASEAGANYLMLASASGVGSVNFGGIQVPLVRDALYLRTLLQPPVFLQGARGRLDVIGTARVELVLAPQAALPWVGRTIHLAAVTFEASQGRLASVAVPLQIIQ